MSSTKNLMDLKHSRGLRYLQLISGFGKRSRWTIRPKSNAEMEIQENIFTAG